MSKKNKDALFTSNSDEWATPQIFFDDLNKSYSFVFDLACSKENCKTASGFTLKDNALLQNWANISISNGNGWLWLNPPYSKCSEFVNKAYYEMLLGAKIIMLIPSRTDTKWFHDYIYNKDGVTIKFIKGRLKFGDSKNSASFPSMLIKFEKI